MQGFTAADWKLFRNKIGEWQEAYMDKLNKEYIELLNGDKLPSEKFWELEKRIKNDKKSAGVMLEMTRSQFIRNIIHLIDDGAITFDDIKEFSGELKESVGVFIDRK